MASCDACPSPGVCCRRMTLSIGGMHLTVWEDEGAAGALQLAVANGVPFVPVRPVVTLADHETGRNYQQWLFSCPHVQTDGRCSIYDDRPQVCRSYEPGTDSLCAFHPDFHG